jgi:hypothetical protein
MAPASPADVAYDLEQQVVAACAVVRRSWAQLAGRLHEFFSIEGWKPLGYDSFAAWLGQPEIGLRRDQAYRLVEAWRELVVARGIEPGELERLDVTKVETVLPALRRGDVEADEALADIEVLSRSDLRIKYQEGDDATYVTCESCGSRIRPEKT